MAPADTNPRHPWVTSIEASIYLLSYPETTRRRAAERHADELRSLYRVLADWTSERRAPYVFVVDLTHSQSGAADRKMATSYFEQVKKRGTPYLAGRAFVTPNAQIRGVMTAVFWNSPPNYPHNFFENTHDALVWARQQLTQWTLSATG